VQKRDHQMPFLD